MDVLYSGQAYNLSQTGGLNPYTILDRNMDELKTHFKNKEKTLKTYNLAPEAHNQAIANMQQEYDEAKFRFASTRIQLDDIKRGMSLGQINSMEGQRAMLQLVAPESTVRATFPKVQQQQRGRFTPNEFASYVKEFGEVAKSTIVNPWGWGKASRKHSDPEQLKEQYFSVRAKYGYDADMNQTEKKAFDLAWDQAISSNKMTLTTWKDLVKNDPDIFMSRTYDARLLDIARKKATGQSISPMAKAFEKKKELNAADVQVTPTKPTKPSSTENTNYFDMPIEELMQVNVNEGLPRILSDVDYDKLPSGTQFIDPKGVKRTKP